MMFVKRGQIEMADMCLAKVANIPSNFRINWLIRINPSLGTERKEEGGLERKQHKWMDCIDDSGREWPGMNHFFVG